MQDDAILGQVVLGHSAMIDKARSIVATRLTVFPEQRDAPPDAQALLDRLLVVWPAPAASDDAALTLRSLGSEATASQASSASSPAATGVPSRATPLLLNIASESWLKAMLELTPPPHIMVEVPSFMASDPQHASMLKALHAKGTVMAIKGRPVQELPLEMLPCFRHSLIDVGEDRRSGAPAPDGAERAISHIQLGVRRRADVDVAFERGAVAVLGWPLEDEPQASATRTGGPDLQTVMALMQRAERDQVAAHHGVQVGVGQLVHRVGKAVGNGAGADQGPGKVLAHACTTRCVCVPRPCTPRRMVWPARRYTGGLWPMPTPGGVPVEITSPLCKLMKRLR